MIGRAQAVKFPGRARQNAVFKFIAVAPPEIPRAAQKRVGDFLRARQFVRQQAADAEQPRLNFKRGIRAARPARFRLRQILHRPDVVLVAERAEQIFPQRLLPAGIFRAGQHRVRLVLKTHFRGGVQQFRELRFGKLAQRRGAFAAQTFRQAGFIFERQREFGQRRVEQVFQRQSTG